MSDIDMQGIADRLFGSASTPAAPAATETPAAPTDAAEATAQLARGAEISDQAAAGKAEAEAQQRARDARDLAASAKPELPDAVRELRNTPERRLFFADTFKTAVDTAAAIAAASPLADVKSMTGLDLTAEQLEAIKPAVAAELHAIYTDAGLTHEEAQTVESVIVDVRTNKPDDATQVQATIAALNERYGQGAKQALADAQAYIARDPRIGKMLDMSRAGNDSRMVMLAVEAAQRARARGEKF